MGQKQRPVIVELLERLDLARVERAVVVTRPDKGNIASTLGACYRGVSLEYIDTERTPSSVHTITTALRQHPEQAHWVLGFPDIVFEPADAYARAIRHFDQTKADLVLGLVPSDRPDKADMVQCDEHGSVCELQIKRADCTLRNTWIVACWGPRFSALLCETVESSSRTPSGSTELFVGTVINTAINQGLRVCAITMPEGWALDIGIPGDLERAQQLS